MNTTPLAIEALKAERLVNLTSAQHFVDLCLAAERAGDRAKANEYAIIAERHDERAEWLAIQIRKAGV